MRGRSFCRSSLTCQSIMNVLVSAFLLAVAAVVAVQADDEFCDPMFTKSEVEGFANSWCKKAEWITTFMNRKIECRNKFYNDRPEAKTKAEDCVVKAWTGVKGVGEFDIELIKKEETYRELVCKIEDKKEFSVIMKAVYDCISPGEDAKHNYMKEIHKCMASKARKEEKGEARK